MCTVVHHTALTSSLLSRNLCLADLRVQISCMILQLNDTSGTGAGTGSECTRLRPVVFVAGRL